MNDQPRKRTRRTETPVREGHEGVMWLRRVHYEGAGIADLDADLAGSHEETETIRVPYFETEPARVKVSGSITRNMDDYNSIRVEVSLDLPALPEMSEVNRVYAIASTWVEDSLSRELQSAESLRGPTDGQTEAAAQAHPAPRGGPIQPIPAPTGEGRQVDLGTRGADSPD